jgi:hypothetical protein
MKWRRIFQRDRRDEELAREIESYLQHEIDRHNADKSSEEILRAARKKLGKPTSGKRFIP